MQVPAAMNVTVPEDVTLQLTLAEFAENVTTPPGAVARTVYAPRYVGLTGYVVNRMCSDAWPTENDGMICCGALLYCEFPAWFATIAHVPTPIIRNTLLVTRAQTLG